MRTYDNIQTITAGQRNDYTTVCLLSYPYFKEQYKMIAADLTKQKARDADPKAIQQINFNENLDQDGNTTIIIIIEEAKQTILNFSQGTVSVVNLYCFNVHQYNWVQMIQYNWVNVKLCNSQLTRLKSGIKNDTEVILILSLNAIGDSHDETNFLIYRIVW